MLNSAISLFLLRELPFSRFDFPRWKAVLAISFIGLLVGLDPNFRTPPPGLTDVPLPPLWMALMLGLVLVWVSFVIIVGVMRWWLKRGGRWDGQGNLFNLIASSWLVSNVLGAGLTALWGYGRCSPCHCGSMPFGWVRKPWKAPYPKPA